jgi:hypothetical protein
VDTLNDRPPLVLDASAWRPNGEPFDFTVVANHLRSLIGIDDPADGARVRAKRRAQAEYLAALVQDRQAATPSARILVVGDFNAFEFSDGYVDSIGTIRGVPTGDAHVVLASPDLVDPDLVNLIDRLTPDQRYSYVYDGNAQAIDHALATMSMAAWVGRVAFGRSNADFPQVYRSDPSRPERLCDHDGLVTYVSLGTPRLSGRVSGTGPDGTIDIQITNSGASAFDVVIDQVGFRTLAGAGTVSLGAPLPIRLGDLGPGQTVILTLPLVLPPGVTRFSIAESGSLRDAGGRAYRFSMGQAVMR